MRHSTSLAAVSAAASPQGAVLAGVASLIFLIRCSANFRVAQMREGRAEKEPTLDMIYLSRWKMPSQGVIRIYKLPYLLLVMIVPEQGLLREASL